jgi:hypothetical protein
VFARATNDGRLLEFGGVQPFVSADAGRTWQAVQIPVPSLLSGEGAIVAGHDDEVFGVGWAPYDGDAVQALSYSRAAGWALGAAPVHTPLYDRPWVTYARGPFTVNGVTSAYATVVHGGANNKDVSTLLSTDGTTYVPTTPARDAASAPPVPFRIPVVRNADADQWQPSPFAYSLPLNAGGLLIVRNPDDGFSCQAVRLDQASGRWQCVTLPFEVTGTVRQDSRGWLTMLTEASYGEGSAFRLSVSTDGGHRWRSVLLRAPRGGRFEGSFHYDVVTNGRLGQAAVVSRFLDEKGHGQDLVWRVDISGPQPRVARVYELGRGDVVAPGGADFSKAADAVDRVDFPTVALLPDGRIAASVTDSTTPNGGDESAYDGLHSPALAVLDA